jgi:hypothetical protein
MANSRMHWRVKNRKRVEYFNACGLISLGWPLWDVPAKVRLTATIYCGGRMDTDNALSRLKWPADFLVRAGYLRGDNPDQLEWHWPIEQVVSRKQTYRVEFELEAA